MTDAGRAGRIVVPADLDAVTDVGEEDHLRCRPPRSNGSGRRPVTGIGRACTRRSRLPAAQRESGAQSRDRSRARERTGRSAGRRTGAGRHRHAVLRVLGGQGDHHHRGAHARRTRSLLLDDRVCDYLPEYTSHGKDRTTIRHVLTHSAGVPFASGPRPSLRRMNDSEYTRRKLAELKPIHRPGRMHIYHGLTWGPLVREIVRPRPGRTSATSWPPRFSIRSDSGGRITVWPRAMFRWWRPVT